MNTSDITGLVWAATGVVALGLTMKIAGDALLPKGGRKNGRSVPNRIYRF